MDGMGQSVVHASFTSSVVASAAANAPSTSPGNYFTYPEYGGLILAHILLMTIAWFFVLPIGEQSARTGLRLRLTV